MKFPLLTIATLLTGVLYAIAPGRELPELKWEMRSDWIDVKTLGARGDGRADDTAAIQQAIDSVNMGNNGKKTVFLPPGVYRITRTLSNPKNDLAGLTLLGCGRGTVVRWDGPEHGVMFHSNGIHRSRYIGIVWDGANRAGTAFDHRSQGRYETRIRHQNCAFRNVTGTGLRVGYEQKMASAEIWIENCLFENCRKAGMEYLAWNDYDNTVSGCGFYDCGIAVNVEKGNVYVRDCHFENSAKSDFLFCSHSHSVRRCTSRNSYMFVDSQTSGATQEWVVEDCRVAGWKNPDGAIVSRMRGANLVMDTVFSDAPNKNPVVRFAHPSELNQTLVFSNVQTPTGVPFAGTGKNVTVTEIPPGELGGALSSPDQTFLQPTWRIPTKVFDVKDFGARGDGRSDDAPAITRAIAAARAHGRDAIAYLPAGTYNIAATLEIGGADYFVGGSGYSTILRWTGPAAGGPMIRIRETAKVMLEQFQLHGPDPVCRIEHAGTGKPSWIGYDGVYVGGSFRKGKPLLRGLECRNLGVRDTIFAPHFDGSMKFVSSGASDNLICLSYDGVIEVEGRDNRTGGFIAALSRANAGNEYDIVVRDSQSLVISDYYTEQTKRLVKLEGKPGDAPGVVFIQGAKAGTDLPESIDVDNYRGTLYYGNAQFCYTSPTVRQRGENPVNLILMCNMFWDRDPVFQLGPTANLILAGNLVGGKSRHVYPDKIDSKDLKTVAEALDWSRRIGRRDLKFNYPNIEIK